MFNRLLLLVCVFIYVMPTGSDAQANCDITLSGKIICADDRQTLPGANIQVGDTPKGTQADSSGKFVLDNLCAGKVTFHISYIGYFPLDTTLILSQSKKANFYLHASETHLHEVMVEGQAVHKQEVETVTKAELKGEQLQQTRGEDLGDALKEVTGVDVIHSGPTVAKPVIHGLHSNRILILNNGVRQEGQQWGSEHAPEIDPFIATKLSVIKGAASIRYGSDALGGVVLVEPAEMPKEKSMGGEINLVGMDNSRLYCGSGILQGAFDNGLSGLSYRVQGTYRRAGNLEAPNYYLDNTSLKERNYSADMAYNKEHYGVNIYYSRFNTDYGIYSGAHIGNSADLLNAYNGVRPIEDNGFSYDIKRGYQSVDHDLVKASAYLKDVSFGKLEAVFARQVDHREEFDVSLPYSANGVDLSTYPEANFQLVTHTAELIWEHNAFHHLTGSIGTNFITQGNVYEGLTFRSIIPNFRNYGGGLFVIEKWVKDRTTIEGGVRYDYKWQREYALDNSKLNIVTPTQQYDNITSTLGMLYRISKKVSLNANAGNAWRAPSVYELYANGVHGSTASYEVGDSALKSERAFNLNASLRFETGKLDGEIGGYVNVINNYIYLQPQQKFIVTYAGYFPLFDFKQTDALFKGIDANVKWHITDHLQLEPKATLVYANDLKTNGYLVLIPAQRVQAYLEYRWKTLRKFSNVFVNVGGVSVAEQKRVPPNSDFVPPPKGYSLLMAAIGLSIPAGKQMINVSLQGENLLNTAYRDYLNFFRYYSDNPGRTIQLRIQIPFQIIHKN